MAVRTHAAALTAKLVLVAQCNVDHAPLAAVHRVEAERRARVFDFLGRGHGTDAELGDTQCAIVVRIEGNARMIVRVQPQRFLRHQLERQQQFGAISQQQIHIRAGEFHQNVGIFEIRIGMIPGANGELQIEPGVRANLAKEIFDSRTRFFNRIFRTQARFLPLIFPVAGSAGAAITGTVVLLKNHCCAIPKILLVSQYNTSPLD